MCPENFSGLRISATSVLENQRFGCGNGGLLQEKETSWSETALRRLSIFSGTSAREEMNLPGIPVDLYAHLIEFSVRFLEKLAARYRRRRTNGTGQL